MGRAEGPWKHISLVGGRGAATSEHMTKAANRPVETPIGLDKTEEACDKEAGCCTVPAPACRCGVAGVLAGFRQQQVVIPIVDCPALVDSIGWRCRVERCSTAVVPLRWHHESPGPWWKSVCRLSISRWCGLAMEAVVSAILALGLSFVGMPKQVAKMV